MKFLLTLGLCAALLCPLWAYSFGLADWSKNNTGICKRATNWTIQWVVPMKSFRGDVVVVALLKASLPLSLKQASKISHLRNRLRDDNITEVSYMIVNAQETASRAKYWDLKRSAPGGVPVFQQDANKRDVWDILGGELHDFLIYDRYVQNMANLKAAILDQGQAVFQRKPPFTHYLLGCGRLTYHIGTPWSYYFNPHVQAAIQATYQSNICNCSITTSTVKAKVRQKVRINEGALPDYVFKEFKVYYHPPHS